MPGSQNLPPSSVSVLESTGTLQEALLGSGSLLQLSHSTARADPDIATLFALSHVGQHCLPVQQSR